MSTTTTKYADMGTVIQVISYDENMVHEKLKPAVYSVGFNKMTGFFLNKKGDRLPTPDRLYGSVKSKVNKIMKSYQSSEGSFGVLLSGDKGSGKTMTSSLTANECIDKLNLPVILVEDSFEGSGFVDFITKLGECVIFIDEFGKKFNDREGEQTSLLGLFDGTSSGKRMVVLTENNTQSINPYIMNRPGRVHYHFRHEKIEEDIIREYCESFDIDPIMIDDIVLRRDSSYEFSFDVLQAIVVEYTRFGGSISEICDDLNIERPSECNTLRAVLIAIKDITNNCIREIAEDHSSETRFPDKNHYGEFVLKNLSKDNNNIVDTVSFGTRNIIGKEGKDVFIFKNKDDEGNDLIIKIRRIEQTPVLTYTF